MANDPNQFGLWRPWHPAEVARLFSALTAPWWIAGGWALDLFLGEQTHDHEDIDVQILRRDQQNVREIFRGWDVQEAHPGDLPAVWPFREWEAGEALSPKVHDVWCRPNKIAPWVLQLMIAETIDDQWLFRRDARLCRPLSTIGRQTEDGLPYLAPEIQLLYKAKAPRPKDEADFARVLPFLHGESRQWLAQSLALVHPGHFWLAELTPTSS
jgi:Aminoglycoside-2''-adenylyltransferase